jgi:hypothetical protein
LEIGTSMSLFISDSDSSCEWGRWLGLFLCTTLLGSSLLFAFVVLVDPYDSGRLGLLKIDGVNDWNQRTANASRAKDPQFDSAIIGNSHGQIINPAELSRRTGASFVQLTVPGTASREQLTVLDFFTRHHRHIDALVVITDEVWCTHDRLLPPAAAFPFWLYDENTFGYLSRLLSWRALDHSLQRVMIGVGWRRRSVADGFSDYEEIKIKDRHPDLAEPNHVLPSVGGISNFFPAIALLESAIRKLPADVAVILVVPPVFFADTSRPDSNETAEQGACDLALKGLVADRSNSSFIDYRVSNALTRDRQNFVDRSHYRAKIARKMEEGIAAAVRLGKEAHIDF